MPPSAPPRAPDLSDITSTLITDCTKGFPVGHAPLPLRDIGRQGWSVLNEDVPFPVAVLRKSALDGNRRFMRAFLERTHALLAPHGKTSMSPQLFALQLEDGAHAITVATPSQLAVCRRYGFSRVVLANQLVGRQAIRGVLALLAADADFELTLLVDSTEGVAALATEAARQGLARPVRVLLEGGFVGGRTGCRTMEDALVVARAVHAETTLTLVGVEGFEGLIHTDDHADDEGRVVVFLDFLVDIAQRCAREGLFGDGPLWLSAGGSAYYDLVVERLKGSGIADMEVLLRCGCTLTHDALVYQDAFTHLQRRSEVARGLPETLRPALEVWSVVQSRPEPTRAILTVGKRDLGQDYGLPVPTRWHRMGQQRASPLSGHSITDLNDQHAYLQLPEHSPLRPGDLVCLGISHPCTTFDKWRMLYVVDDDERVLDAVLTFF